MALSESSASLRAILGVSGACGSWAMGPVLRRHTGPAAGPWDGLWFGAAAGLWEASRPAGASAGPAAAVDFPLFWLYMNGVFAFLRGHKSDAVLRGVLLSARSRVVLVQGAAVWAARRALRRHTAGWRFARPLQAAVAFLWAAIFSGQLRVLWAAAAAAEDSGAVEAVPSAGGALGEEVRESSRAPSSGQTATAATASSSGQTAAAAATLEEALSSSGQTAAAAATLEEEFNAVLQHIKTFKPSKTVPNERKLIFYGLFKQIENGDVTTARPGGMMNLEGKYKWDSWNSCKGKSKEDCWKAYVEEFNKQKAEFA